MALVQARQVDGGGATKTAFGRLDFDGATTTLAGVTDAVRGAIMLSRSDHRGPCATPQPGARIAAVEIEVSDGAEDRLHVRVCHPGR
jgi:hypothetical protein